LTGVRESASSIRATWEASERWLNDHQQGDTGRSENVRNGDFSVFPWLSGRSFEAQSLLGIKSLPSLDGHTLKPFKGLEEGLRSLG